MSNVVSNWANKWIVALLVGGMLLLQGAALSLTLVRTNADPDAGRIVLCTGIIANVSNVARDEPQVIELCRTAGVDRDDYPDTVLP